MTMNERLDDIVSPLAERLLPRENVDALRRVNRGLDNQGRPILDHLDFIPLRSPDGSVWRVRIDNAGVLSAKKVS